MRLLIIKLSSFGDVIHTFPALTDLAAVLPDAAVDWIVEEDFAATAATHPAVRRVLPFAQRRMRWPPWRWPALRRARQRLAADIRAADYDLVVDLQGLLKSAALTRLSKAPSVGYDAASAREPLASRFYGRTIAVDRHLHAVERTRRLLAAAAGYAVPATPPDFGLRTAAAAPPQDLALPARYGIAIHAASWPTKLWPEDRWRTLLSARAAAGEATILPWGSDEERQRAQRLAVGIDGAQPLPRRLTGPELAAVFAGAAWAVGLDSGPMHLCAALDVPGVWLFGPTDPGLTGPVGAAQTVIRSTHPAAPCRRRVCHDTPDGLCCMRGIAEKDVETALARQAAALR